MSLTSKQLKAIGHHLQAISKILEAEISILTSPVDSRITPETDPVTEFLQTHLIPAPGHEVTTRDLRITYAMWCQERGLPPVHYRTLFRRIPGPRRNANSQFRFLGWKLR